MRTASRLLARVFDEALGDARLNVTQLAVLRAIERTPGEALRRVAEQLSMDRSSVYRTVAAMERQGWLKLADGPDARSRTATITRAGRTALDEAAPHWEDVQSAIVDRFGRRRWQALVGELQALADVAGAVDLDLLPRSAPRG